MTTSVANKVEAKYRFRRASSLLIAASIAAVVLWAAGLFPATWIDWLLQKFKHQSERSVAAMVRQPEIKPFDNPSGAPPPPKGNDSSISETPLPLILTGTMPGKNSREGLAYLGVSKDSPQTYQAGALLANGARIAAIYSDHITLEKKGHSVDLYVDGSGKQSKKVPEGILTVGGEGPPKMAVATVHEILTDYIRASPVYDGNVLRGYQVYAGQKAGVFSQMGLQAGDVITSVNGVPLIEPQSAYEQLRRIAEGYPVTVTVERKEGPQALSLDGGLIVRDQQGEQNAANPSIDMPPM